MGWRYKHDTIQQAIETQIYHDKHIPHVSISFSTFLADKKRNFPPYNSIDEYVSTLPTAAVDRRLKC